jgi:hypothetical protein
MVWKCKIPDGLESRTQSSPGTSHNVRQKREKLAEREGFA